MWMKFIAAAILFVCTFVLACVFGAADIALKDVWLALTSSNTNEQITILREIRFPREVAALFVGSALAVSGAIMQGVTRNPLADPGLLGLTAGATVALSIGLACFPTLNYFGMMITCFIGASCGAFIVMGIGSIKRGGFSPVRIVLAGSAVTAFLIAVSEGVAIAFKVSKHVSMWTAGGLVGTTWQQIYVIAPIIMIGIGMAIIFAKQVTILSLHEEVAIGLGLKTKQVKIILFVVTVILTGTSVALVGNMAFIGLIVPHVVRFLVQSDYRLIIPMCALLGASFMLVADTIGRTMNAPYETPVIAVTAVMGLLFFIVIVRKGGHLSA